MRIAQRELTQIALAESKCYWPRITSRVVGTLQQLQRWLLSSQHAGIRLTSAVLHLFLGPTPSQIHSTGSSGTFRALEFLTSITATPAPIARTNCYDFSAGCIEPVHVVFARTRHWAFLVVFPLSFLLGLLSLSQSLLTRLVSILWIAAHDRKHVAVDEHGQPVPRTGRKCIVLDSAKPLAATKRILQCATQCLRSPSTRLASVGQIPNRLNIQRGGSQAGQHSRLHCLDSTSLQLERVAARACRPRTQRHIRDIMDGTVQSTVRWALHVPEALVAHIVLPWIQMLLKH